MMTEIVFTGFPGFIASQLIRKAAREHHAISAIILPEQRVNAEQEAEKIRLETGCVPIRLIEGDITKSNLNMSEEDADYLRGQDVFFWHLAAIYDLAVPRQAAWKVNVEGTENVNNFILSIPNLKRYMYFSTAYVAGSRQGTIYEHELIRPEKFKNFYEETKFEAELLTEKLKLQVPLTIIRPGIVRGNSITGETVKFDGPYFFMNMIDKVRKSPIIPYLGRSSAFINVVPIDYILEASTYLSTLPEAAGKTVHLTDPNPHPVEEVYRRMVSEMTGKVPKARIPHQLAEWSLAVSPIRKFLGVEKESLDYLAWKASFDTGQAQILLNESGIRCADFLESMPQMVRFYELHKSDKKYQIVIR